jgi:hypothetical protein
MRTKKTILILLSGKAGAGKTTVADLLGGRLIKDGLQCLRYSFSNPIKHIAKSFIGWNQEKDDRGRKLLQDIGNVGRSYDIDFLCKHLINFLDKSKEMFPYNFIFVDDWRFPNEAEFFKKNPMFEVVKVRVSGRGGLNGELANDATETSLPEDKDYYDIKIDNSTDLIVLVAIVENMIIALKEKYVV